MKRSPGAVDPTPQRALPAGNSHRRGNEEGFDYPPFFRGRSPHPTQRTRKEQPLPDYNLSPELTNSTFDSSNTSWESDWSSTRGTTPKSEPPFYKYRNTGSYQSSSSDWSTGESAAYGVMHNSQQSSSNSPSASSSSYYDSNDYYGYGYDHGYQQQQTPPFAMHPPPQQQQHPYPPMMRTPCDGAAPYNGNRNPSSCPPSAGKQMVADYRRQTRFGMDSHGRLQTIKREPEDFNEQDGENFTSLFTKSLTSLYSQDPENTFPDENKTYDPDIMILDAHSAQPAAQPHMDDVGYQRLGPHYGMPPGGYPNQQGPRNSFAGFYENRNQNCEPPPNVVQDLNADDRANAFRYDRPSFDDMHLYASNPNESKSQAKKRKLSMPNIAPEGGNFTGSENRKKGPRLMSFKSDSKWTPNSFAFSDVQIKQEPTDDYEDMDSQNRNTASCQENSTTSNGSTPKPQQDQPKPVVRKRSPGTTCFDRFEKKSTSTNKKVSPLSVYAKVQDCLVLNVKCRRYKKRTKPITSKDEAVYPGREEIEHWKKSGAYNQSPDQAVRLLMNELMEKVSRLDNRNIPEGLDLPPLDITKVRELLFQFCQRYSVDFMDFENIEDLKPRMVQNETAKNFERASAIRKRTNISPARPKTPPPVETKTPKSEKVMKKVVNDVAKTKVANEVAKPAGRRNLRKLPGRVERGRQVRRRISKVPIVTRRYSTRSAKDDGTTDVDIIIDSSTDRESEAGKEAEVPKKSQRLKNKHPVVQTPAKADNTDKIATKISKTNVDKEETSTRSRSKRQEAEKAEDVFKASPKKKWSRLHINESSVDSTEGKKSQAQSSKTVSNNDSKTESDPPIKRSERTSSKNARDVPIKQPKRKYADKIICDSVLSSSTFNLFSRQTRRKSFDVVEIDCEEKEIKGSDDKNPVKATKHSEEKSSDKASNKKESIVSDAKKTAISSSKDNSSNKSKPKREVHSDSKKRTSTSTKMEQQNPVSKVDTRLSSESKIEKKRNLNVKEERQCNEVRRTEKQSISHSKVAQPSNSDPKTSKQCSDKQSSKTNRALKSEDENSDEEPVCATESEKKLPVILESEKQFKDQNTPKSLKSKHVGSRKENKSTFKDEKLPLKKKDYTRFVDVSDPVVQIKLTKLPSNYNSSNSPFKTEPLCESNNSSVKLEPPWTEVKNDSPNSVANVLEQKVKSHKTDAFKSESKIQSRAEVFDHREAEKSSATKPEAQNIFNEPDIDVCVVKSNNPVKTENRSSEVKHSPRQSERSCSSKESGSSFRNETVAENDAKIPLLTPKNISCKNEIPSLEPNSNNLVVLNKPLLVEVSEKEMGTSDSKSLEKKEAPQSPNSSGPPLLVCMKECKEDQGNEEQDVNDNRSVIENSKSEDTLPPDNLVVSKTMPSILPILEPPSAVAEESDGSRPQPISLHRRSESEDSDCGGLVIDLDRRQSIEDRVPSPTFQCDDGKASKEAEPSLDLAIRREPTPSTSGYSSTSRASNKSVWGLDDSEDDDDCIMLDGERRRSMDVTFASLETAAKEHAKKMKDSDESILRSLLLENEVSPGTSQIQSQASSDVISAECQARIRSDVMKLLMFQANHSPSASSGAEQLDLKKLSSDQLPPEIHSNLMIESEEGDDKENPVDAKERIKRLKNEITYLQCMAEQKDKERTAIVCFKRYKEEVLRRLIKEYAFNVQEHVRDWLRTRQDSEPEDSAGQTSSASFPASFGDEEELDRLWNEFIVWVEHRSVLAEPPSEDNESTPTLAHQVLRLAYSASVTTSSSSISTAANNNTPNDSQSGEQLPAVSTMVAKATENYGVDMRTMRNESNSGSSTTQTILQQVLSTKESIYSPRPSTSRSSPSSEIAVNLKSTSHHQKQSVQMFTKSSTFTKDSSVNLSHSSSPSLPELRPSRNESPSSHFTLPKSRSPKDLTHSPNPSRSPPSLQPELRPTAKKVFSPQPSSSEKNYPLDLIVSPPAPTKSEAHMKSEKTIRKVENPFSRSSSSSQKSENHFSASQSSIKPKPLLIKTETHYRKADHTFTKSENHFIKSEKSFTKTESPFTKPDISFTKGEIPITKSETSYRKSSSSLPRSESPFRKSESPYTKSETPYTKSESPYTKSESPYTKSESPYTKSESPFRKTESPFAGSMIPFGKTESPFSRSANYFSPPESSFSRSAVPINKPEIHYAKSENHFSKPENHMPKLENHFTKPEKHMPKLENHYSKPDSYFVKTDNHFAKSESRYVKSEHYHKSNNSYTKPEAPFPRSVTPFSKSETPFSKPGPSSKPLEAATAFPFKSSSESSKSRRVASSPKRRPGYSYSAWTSIQNGRNAPESATTLDLRTEHARAKDSMVPKREPSANGHSSSRQFMVVPPPTTLQQAQRSSSSSSSHHSRSHSNHHNDNSHLDSIERIYSRRTEDERRSLSYSSQTESNGVLPYHNGASFPLPGEALNLSPPPNDENSSAVKCLGCGVSDAKFLCSGCRKHWYCSPHCQTMRWPEHSQECGRVVE